MESEEGNDSDGLFPENNGSGYSDSGPVEYFDADDLPALQDVDENGITPHDIRDSEGALDVVTDGRLAYLAYGSAGVFIVDISDPTEPKRLGNHPTARPAEKLALKDKLLVVTCGISGTQLLDVSAPQAIKPLGVLRTTCFPMDAAIDGWPTFCRGRILRRQRPANFRYFQPEGSEEDGSA